MLFLQWALLNPAKSRLLFDNDAGRGGISCCHRGLTSIDGGTPLCDDGGMYYACCIDSTSTIAGKVSVDNELVSYALCSSWCCCVIIVVSQSIAP